MCDCGNSGLGKYGARVGGQIGDFITNRGTALAQQAAKRIKSWTGFGDYKIVANSLIEGAAVPYGGNFSSQGRLIQIKHREYLGEVTTASVSGAFQISSYRINPANISTFPWFSTIASQFDQYRIKGMIFEFISTATDSTNTTASLGSVIMCTDYDVLDDEPSSKQQMLQMAYSQEGRSCDSMVHGIECDPEELQRQIFYTRAFASTSPTTVGPRDYDVGIFYIATQGGGLPANQSIGSLYVHYDIEMFKPQPYGGISANTTLYTQKLNYLKNGEWTVFNQMNVYTTWQSTNVQGVDLGITAINDSGDQVWTFPKRLQGAYMELMRYDACDSARDWPTGGPGFPPVENGCTTLLRGPLYPFPLTNAAGYVYNQSTLQGDINRQWFWRAIIKLDDVLEEDATWRTRDPIADFPFTPGDAFMSQIRWTIIPKSMVTSTKTW